MSDQRERLKNLILERSFQWSDRAEFRLASGNWSHFYFNCKKTTMDPEGAYLVGQAIFQAVRNRGIDGVGGLTLGADPMAAAAMHAAWHSGHRIKQFVVRKQLKDHGSIRWIEGNMEPGDKVIILEDVVTTGGSTIKAMERAAEDGLDVRGVLVLVDREEEGGAELIRKHCPGPVEALFTRSELMGG
jgi:orotate phosphoribosyltransferase